jgi:hypothetical protein
MVITGERGAGLAGIGAGLAGLITCRDGPRAMRGVARDRSIGLWPALSPGAKDLAMICKAASTGGSPPRSLGRTSFTCCRKARQSGSGKVSAAEAMGA